MKARIRTVEAGLDDKLLAILKIVSMKVIKTDTAVCSTSEMATNGCFSIHVILIPKFFATGFMSPRMPKP